MNPKNITASLLIGAMLTSVSISFASSDANAAAALTVARPTQSAVKVLPAPISLEKEIDSTMIIPDYIPVNTPVSYTFDASKVKELASEKKASLMRLGCNTGAILQTFGLANLPKGIYSVGINKDGMDYSLDLRNCSIYGYRQDAILSYSQPNRITLEESKKLLEKSMASGSVLSSLPFTFGTPVVTSKNNGYPIMYKEGGNVLDTSLASTGTTASGSTSTGTTSTLDMKIMPPYYNPPKDDGKYSSVTYVLPYLFKGKMVYNSDSGTPVGMSVDITGSGVSGVNGSLIALTNSSAVSERMSPEAMITHFEKGGKSPYYSEKSVAIKMGAPERVVVYFEIYRNGKTERFISSGIRMTSDTKALYSDANFTMTASDYRIGNEW